MTSEGLPDQAIRPKVDDRGIPLSDIASWLGTELQGDGSILILRLNTLQDAGVGELAFLANKSYRSQLATTQASALILSPADAENFDGNALIHANPYVCYARVTALFDAAPRPAAGVHSTAVIDASARVAPSASVGPHVVIGARVTIGERVRIGAGSSIGDDSAVGDDTNIAANVSIYHSISIGKQVNVHSGSVIGADGFGFANDGGQWVKIHQLGGVEIGDRVEIGACTTIDRGALGNTVIENGVILDNHVQIAHNVRLGENTAMAAYSGIAGSTTVGKNCIFAGQAGAVGHVTVCDNVQAMARCTLSKSVTEPGSYSSGLLMSETPKWRKNAVRFGQLNDMALRLKKLEVLLGEKLDESLSDAKREANKE
ncbi:MAG: UDP-3-O-(3-hydroxymyristoyl)glucosamine N-acyltransferase [Porticoccaceae bacterium]